MGEHLACDCLDNFNKCVMDLFMLEYLRKPTWSDVQKIYEQHERQHGYFKRKQESAQKDIERAFGVLQGRWGILQQPTRQMEIVKIQRIMYTCIILHNMILKDQKFALREYGELWVDLAPRLRQER